MLKFECPGARRIGAPVIHPLLQRQLRRCGIERGAAPHDVAAWLALLERLGGARVEAASAGSHPKPVHPNAVRAMRASGIDIGGRHPKHLDVFADQRFDHVISLCDRVREVCPQFRGTPAVAHWSMPDPAAEPGYAPFVRAADELRTRITFLLQAIDSTARSER